MNDTIQNNILLITGKTYPHARELANNKALFDSGCKLWRAPIGERVAIEELCQKLKLEVHESYDAGFKAPTSDAEWDLAKASSQLNANRIKRLEVLKRIDELADSSEAEGELNATKETEKELSEKITTLEEKLQSLEKVVKDGEWGRLQFKSLSESDEYWFSKEPPPQPMLLRYVKKEPNGNVIENKNWLPLSQVGMLCGSGGVGKTRWLLALAYSVATGKSFLECFEVVNGPRKVFVGLGEEPREGIWRRLYDVGLSQCSTRYPGSPSKELELARSNLVVESFRGMDMRLIDDHGTPTAQYWQLLEGLQASAGKGYSLIILDPIARHLAGDEKDNVLATKLIALLERMTIEIPGNPTILFGHHMNKSSKEDKSDQGASRGASGLTDGVRWQVNLWTPTKKDNKTKVTQLRAFQHAKVNDVPYMPAPMILKFNERGVLVPALSIDCSTHEYEGDSFKGYSNHNQQASPQKAKANNQYLSSMAG